jgi:hypothetical protein
MLKGDPLSALTEREEMMPALSTVTRFLLAAPGLPLTPGPSVFSILTRSASQGRRVGLASIGGIELASLTHAVAATLWFSALLLTSALAFSIVKYLRGCLPDLSRRAYPSGAAREFPDTSTSVQELLPIVCPGLPGAVAQSQGGPFLLRIPALVCQSWKIGCDRADSRIWGAVRAPGHLYG